MTLQELENEFLNIDAQNLTVEERLDLQEKVAKRFAASQVERIHLSPSKGNNHWNEARESIEIQKQAILKELE